MGAHSDGAQAAQRKRPSKGNNLPVCVEFSCQQLLVADGFLDAMDEATLAEILSSAGGSEFCAPLTEKLSELNALSVGGAVDKKAILTLLKDVGCSKMGVRQKLATVLMCELQRSPPRGRSVRSMPSRCVCALWMWSI